MRPINRGPRPQRDGAPVQFAEYAEARGELIERLGEYCSYCEMHLDSSLAVEHVQPKKPEGAAVPDQARALSWENFLLSCVNCNSTKRNNDVEIANYLWPDRDNTFRALCYSEGGVVNVIDGLPANITSMANNIIRLVGLHKTPNDEKVSDRRWLNRKEAWDMAERTKDRLSRNDNDDVRGLVTDLAREKGFWSVWMTVFRDDTDMLRRFITTFPGTCNECFDAALRYTPFPRPGGQY